VGLVKTDSTVGGPDLLPPEGDIEKAPRDGGLNWSWGRLNGGTHRFASPARDDGRRFPVWIPPLAETLLGHIPVAAAAIAGLAIGAAAELGKTCYCYTARNSVDPAR
jgi:hypothetical protein